jgi:two-component system chemotaxis sensor kinase CheA
MTDFGDEFLEAYLAECDEHLAVVRQALLALEASVGKLKPDRRLTEELFRSFHSLKGLAGMVEDREAEILAHEMEGYLRGVRSGDVRLSTTGIESLIEGTADLERAVRAKRAKTDPQDFSGTLARVRALTGQPAVASQGADSDEPEADELVPTWECVFEPSPALIDRGISVDVVRSRLRGAGEIVSASPIVTDQGVRFRFLVAGPFDAAVAERWLPDGMVCRSLSSEPVIAPQLPVERVAEHTTGHYVRVDLSKLDDLMRMIGDLVILRARLGDALLKIEPHVPQGAWRAVQDQALGIERQLRELREGVMRVRLVPVGEIFRRMPFVVRDLARDTDRRLRVELTGQHTEIDKFLVERMMDPVLHLVRNSVSHGIESVDERIAAGKPPEGTIRLRASASGDLVKIEISDDGRGVDAERVGRRARAMGLPVPAPLDDAALLDLICSPGFSTRDQSDRGSGRGFGMDVVRTTIEELGGSIVMESRPGTGTSFQIELPLTLAITDAFIAAIGPSIFAVPQSGVREVIEVEALSIRRVERGEVTVWRGTAMPVIRLASALNIPVAPRPRLHAFVVGAGQSAVGLIVDRIIGQREIVVRPAVDPLIQVEGVAGATDLGDGRAVLILDLNELARGTRMKEIA